ncbi:MAG: hypothetical protein HYY85_17265 [Deltaproteobacteria bacterium]|nr:hypothetical protein [Deltaproteobacteria bacterium]
MNLVSNIDFLNQAIASQRAALRFHVGLASGVVVLGLGAIVLVHLLAGSVIPDNLKWLLTLGGTFFSTLSGLPLKDIISRKDKVAALIFLRQEFERLQGSAAPADAQQFERLEQRFWQFVDKNLGG